MARKARDYKAEEAARNAKSKAAGFSSRAQERTARRKSKAWSDKHASSVIAKWNLTRDSEYAKAYYDAFVNPLTGFHNLRNGKRTDEAIRHYFVDVMNYYTAVEYEGKYGQYVEEFIYRVKCHYSDGFSQQTYHQWDDAVRAAERHLRTKDRAGKPGHYCHITKEKV